MKYKPKKKFMQLAIEEAKKSAKRKDHAIGAVVVKDNKVISKSGNQAMNNNDTQSHAEMLAIKKAQRKFKTRYLQGCILYTTNEPCAMCTCNAGWARMEGIVFGANTKDMENYWKKRTSKLWKLMKCKEINKGYDFSLFVIGNFMRKQCKKLFEEYMT
jgi:guanine deaminase